MSKFDINILCEVEVETTLIDAARSAAEAALRYEKVRESTGLTLLMTGDSRLHQLNKEFLGNDEPTDVLSFASGEDWEGSEEYLGDIAISISRAESQASSAGHDLGAELCLLTVHGVLHLLDYDHASTSDAKRMWSAQEEILDGLGVTYFGPELPR